MKDIKNFLTEASKDGFDIQWNTSYEYKWRPQSEWLSINVAENHYNWIDKSELDSWIPDYGGTQEEVDAMLAMKPGDVYTPDGWNYYFRFKK